MNQNDTPIIGIDLGTTNSVVAAMVNGNVHVIEESGESLLPSVVGLTTENKLVVGQVANQLAAFPDRTVASVKRRMGEAVELTLGEDQFKPQDVSALILRRLRERAENALGMEITRAVITVPAFFDENQRQATREAGQLAGLTVERIINEPTAASLVYHAGNPERRHVIVYDLGGGTFDVSIVRIEDGVVEVLSSKGDTELGGDDFDQLLAKHVGGTFHTQHGRDLLSDASTRWRLMHACERAKCKLSTTSTARVAEEFIATIDGQPVNLDVEVARHEYEELILPLVERTLACVDQAIRDSQLPTNQIDELILVGGSTRTPLVQRRLREELLREPKWAVNPDLAVALGAATQGAIQGGHSVGPVLIDVATHTLGIEAMSGPQYAPTLVFSPIIHRNSPLPARYEDVYRTMSLKQEQADIHVYQGENPQLRLNRSLGRFMLEGLNEDENSDGVIMVRFELTLDGTLDVTATEHLTGRSKSLQIDNALSQMDGDFDTAEQRLNELYGSAHSLEGEFETTLGEPAFAQPVGPPFSPRADSGPAVQQSQSKVQQVIEKARQLQPSLDSEDSADIDRLVELIEQAERDGAHAMLSSLQSELEDILFYAAE